MIHTKTRRRTMNKPIKVGVVGCGYWGPNLIRNFRGLPDCQLKVMCDLSESRLAHLRSLYPEVDGETNYEHMLNGIGLDAVVIATSVKYRGTPHITPGIEDVTTMSLTFRKQRTAIIQSSWLDPRKVREMTIVGSRRMIVYDDVAPLEKIRIFDTRVERPPHYDTFAEFHYAYHYGDVYVPYVKQEEPLKIECQHFVDCIRQGTTPLTGGQQALELVHI